MSKTEKQKPDDETILITLDQMSQTIDVMTHVVTRLRSYISEQQGETANTGVEKDIHRLGQRSNTHTIH
jgi:ATP:corrinoid adenosyltransferase